MYTWEIRDLINSRGHDISRAEYFNIVRTSPQISVIKYLGGNSFRLIAEELNIRFNVHAE